MVNDVELNVYDSDDIPYVSLDNGSDTLVFPWPLWERIVQYASYEMVSWALQNPEKYQQFNQRMEALDRGLRPVG